MKVTDLDNLYVGYNEKEKFRVLICAFDKQEAYEIAAEYGSDSNLEGEWEISEFSDVNTSFDCDYVITYSKQ